MPPDRLVMLIKGLSFHVKLRNMGKARERRNSWENMRWWGLEAAGRHRAASWREPALQRVSENNELCSLWSPGRRGALKGLAFSYLKIQVTENALDCFVSVFVWTVLLWVEGRYMVSAELKSRCSYDVASSLENGITYIVNGGKPVYFGEEIEVPWLLGVFWWLTAFLPAYYLQAGACTQLDPSTHKCPGADHGLPSVAACPVMFHGLEEASMVS